MRCASCSKVLFIGCSAHLKGICVDKYYFGYEHGLWLFRYHMLQAASCPFDTPTSDVLFSDASQSLLYIKRLYSASAFCTVVHHDLTPSSPYQLPTDYLQHVRARSRLNNHSPARIKQMCVAGQMQPTHPLFTGRTPPVPPIMAATTSESLTLNTLLYHHLFQMGMTAHKHTTA